MKFRAHDTFFIRKGWLSKGMKYVQKKQEENFNKIKESLNRFGVIFSWEYDIARTIHARHIETDTGWKISLDRGLDVYQNFSGDAFDVLTYLPSLRSCKAYEITFINLKK